MTALGKGDEPGPRHYKAKAIKNRILMAADALRVT